jgi:hypothetical protein
MTESGNGKITPELPFLLLVLIDVCRQTDPFVKSAQYMPPSSLQIKYGMVMKTLWDRMTKLWGFIGEARKHSVHE